MIDGKARKDNAAGQLTNEVCFTNGITGSVTNSWQYDEAGNTDFVACSRLRSWRTGDGLWRLYNADSEMLGITTNDAPLTIPITVTGEVEPGPRSNKWYNSWAECRGVESRMSSSDGTFSLPDVPLYGGSNELVVTVTDVSGNTYTTNRWVKKQEPGK